ncbi:MAG: radical SAM protein [Peptococcaceae bacterium BICA1-7]|nr:MAG: radical SAM protein [Peptococcaceae bacterium BICA1-7]HBV97161.1 radical SAM protein [Desulfotomaculum sp.]
MNTPYLNNLAISVERQGPTRIAKASFPLRYGRYSEIITSEYEFVFNLNGEIKFIRGLNTSWPHPAEQLKRTVGNDWVYYTVGDSGGKSGIISWLGEYYLPCLPYPSNSIWEINYSSDPRIMNAFGAWGQLYANLCVSTRDGLYTKDKELIDRITENHEGVLHERSRMLNQIIGGDVSVLPPDTRHVDYEIIPLIIADGCLYHCNFCCVKSANKFQPRSRSNILEQIGRLKDFYGRNIENYSGLFLGNHDALAAGEDLISDSASEAFSSFGLERPGGITPFLYLFGSVHSLLESGNGLFERLNQLPFYTYINIGMESTDQPTLVRIGKPLDKSHVCEAFKKMLDINATYKNIEVTANFLIGEGLSNEHYQSLKNLLRDAPVASHGKGTIYLSPLKDSPKKRELLPLFNKIQEQSKMPVYIYLIQRL